MNNTEALGQFPGVYYLESQNSKMNPIAIRPTLSLYRYVSWEDTDNGRTLRFSKVLIDGEEIRETKGLPHKIEIVSSEGETYTLVKLTKKIFDEKLKGSVAGGKNLNFKNDQELQTYYLKANFIGL